MNWITIYITGKSGFHEEVRHALEGSRLNVMPGSTGNEQDVDLFWMGENVTLKELKKAIGSKVVFKYRLKFYYNLEEILKENQKPEVFTEDEHNRIRQMNQWDATRRYKHSA